jgi:Cu/Ag efflux protein CusF
MITLPWAGRICAAVLFLLAATSAAMAQPLFHGSGVVTAIEPDGSLTINHKTIEGLMPAMEMMFHVRPPALSKDLHPGDEIAFDVEGKSYTIVGVKVTGHTE